MADVKKINGMNINDDTSRTNIGCTQDTYSNETTYAIGDIVVYNNTIYKCITAVTKAEDFTAEKWQQICLRDLLIETRKSETYLNNGVLFTKVNDVVYIRMGNNTSTALVANIIANTLPENFRPKTTINIPCTYITSSWTTMIGRVDISKDGKLTVRKIKTCDYGTTEDATNGSITINGVYAIK